MLRGARRGGEHRRAGGWLSRSVCSQQARVVEVVGVGRPPALMICAAPSVGGESSGWKLCWITRRDEEVVEALRGCHDRIERVLALEIRVA